MFKFLIITFVIIYVLARFAGYFFRLAFWFMGKKVEKEMKKQYTNENQRNRNNEGEIKIVGNISENKPNNFSGGEYVEFEEVK